VHLGQARGAVQFCASLPLLFLNHSLSLSLHVFLHLLPLPLSLSPLSLFSQGRKIVLFDLSFAAKWEGTLLDEQGVSKGLGDGDVSATDLDQDCFTLAESGSGVLELPLHVKATEDGGAVDLELAALFSKHATPLLRARLAAFVAELKARE
jgi:hypothetical protein